jgi:hypothetical protein
MTKSSVTNNKGLLSGNFKSLELILFQLPLESHTEISEVFFAFFSKHKQFDPFLKWALNYEIKQTSNTNRCITLIFKEEYNLLFREDCFTVNILNRVLFDPIGEQYLQTLIGPTLRSICALPHGIQVQQKIFYIRLEQIDANKVNPQTAKENALFLVDQCKQILKTLMKSRWSCPS